MNHVLQIVHWAYEELDTGHDSAGAAAAAIASYSDVPRRQWLEGFIRRKLTSSQRGKHDYTVIVSSYKLSGYIEGLAVGIIGIAYLLSCLYFSSSAICISC